MNNWTYKGVEFTDVAQFPEGTIGFIYILMHKATGKFYVGKKNIKSVRTKALGKKELAQLTDKRSSKKKKVVSESDWKTYVGSNQELKKDIDTHGTDYLDREILYICHNSREMTYQELRHQILKSVLESDNCYNDQILGKFYKKDITY